MPSIPRRVVTGHDERGVSVFAADGPVPVVRTAPDGAFTADLMQTLGTGVLGGLLHDPIRAPEA
ncbi:hypothetical protein [Trebonia sp.]|uniref:hypothetical protein n=1 Tax=Trebonia sp. TaxID=2767075 RepID=UPI00260A1C1A|nr:hypothetical protein [Trebonia sp.]